MSLLRQIKSMIFRSRNGNRQKTETEVLQLSSKKLQALLTDINEVFEKMEPEEIYEEWNETEPY